MIHGTLDRIAPGVHPKTMAVEPERIIQQYQILAAKLRKAAPGRADWHTMPKKIGVRPCHLMPLVSWVVQWKAPGPSAAMRATVIDRISEFLAHPPHAFQVSRSQVLSGHMPSFFQSLPAPIKVHMPGHSIKPVIKRCMMVAGPWVLDPSQVSAAICAQPQWSKDCWHVCRLFLRSRCTGNAHKMLHH